MASHRSALKPHRAFFSSRDKIMLKLIISAIAVSVMAVSLGSNGEDAKLGPRDTIRVTVYDQPDLTLETKLNEAGGITYPLLGDVEIGGLTPPKAAEKIANLLKTKQFIKDPQVSITVLQSHSQMVSVLGEVKTPGLYPVDGKLTVTDILALAGGVTVEGGDTATLIRTVNGSPQRQVIDIVGLTRSHLDTTKNPVLIPNDIVFVDRFQKVYIYGEVTKPGAYRLEPDMTVSQVLSVGGGLSPRGTKRGIRVKRKDATGQLKETVVTLDDHVQAGDILFVRESLF